MVINVSCARHRSVQPIIGSYTLAEGSGLPSSYSSFVNNVSLLSELCLFMFQICRNNPTQIDKFFQFTDQDIQVFVAISHRNNIKYCRLFTIIYTVPCFIFSKLQSLCSKPHRIIQRYNFDGVNTDIEDAYTEDKANLAQLYVDIAEAFRPYSYFLSLRSIMW